MNKSDDIRQIAFQITTAAQSLGINAIRLPDEEAGNLVASVSQKFAKGKTRWLWEMFNGVTVSNSEDNWLLIADVDLPGPFLLFFNQDESTAVFQFSMAQEICMVIGECWFFEFYMTDFDHSFILSLNHHDVLQGIGAIENWLRRHVRNGC